MRFPQAKASTNFSPLPHDAFPSSFAWPSALPLGTPGNAASYKVYVILTTGNERGSNPVTITRPV